MTRLLPADDSGFTLIELVIVVLLLGIIITPLTGTVIIGLATTYRAEQRTTESTDAQLAASWFASDVQSADEVGTSGSCSSGSPVLTLRNRPETGDGTATVITYCRVGESLVRENGAQRITVARTVASIEAPQCYTPPQKPSACPAGGGTDRVVVLSLLEQGKPYGDESRTIALTASRRAS